MKYGVYLPNFGAFGDARRLASLAQEAEEAGWDGFFIWDHINRSFKTTVVDPWVALSAVALSTQRVRIGARVTPLARRRPWKLARETVSLDRLSNGRLIMGVGLGSTGGQEVEWGNFGEETDLKVRGKMLDEGLDVLTGLWSGQPFAYEGEHYRIKETQFLPPPVQTPRIPVWVAGKWPAKPPFRRAARWDGMMPHQFDPKIDEASQMKEAVQFTLSQRSSSDPFDVAFSTPPTPGDDPARAAARVAPFAEAGVTWWLEDIYPNHFGGSWEGEWPVEAMRRRILQGPPGI